MEQSSSNGFRYISSSLIGRYLEGRLDVYWLTVMYLVVILFPEVNVKKRGCKVKKDDLAESFILIYFPPGVISSFYTST